MAGSHRCAQDDGQPCPADASTCPEMGPGPCRPATSDTAAATGAERLSVKTIPVVLPMP